MSGWIKLEKDLLTDPRLLRAAQGMSKAYEYDHTAGPDALTARCNGRPLPGVTLLLGGLAQLWMIADTHISDEDILPLGIDEINQIIGMEGFCEILPPNWLQVIDADNVKLPGYQEHNGPAAKQRALNQRRVETHRGKSNAKPLQGGNGRALPDIDIDIYSEKKNTKKKMGMRIPDDFALNAELEGVAKENHLDPAKTLAAFRDHWLASAQPGAVKKDWAAAFRTWCRSPYNTPQPSRSNGQALKPDTSAEWSELRTHGAAIGFRAPWPQESVGAYRTDLRLFESTPAKFRVGAAR